MCTSKRAELNRMVRKLENDVKVTLQNEAGHVELIKVIDEISEQLGVELRKCLCVNYTNRTKADNKRINELDEQQRLLGKLRDDVLSQLLEIEE